MTSDDVESLARFFEAADDAVLDDILEETDIHAARDRLLHSFGPEAIAVAHHLHVIHEAARLARSRKAAVPPEPDVEET